MRTKSSPGKGGTMHDTAYGVSTASIYDRHVYVPVGFIMSLGPTGWNHVVLIELLSTVQ